MTSSAKTVKLENDMSDNLIKNPIMRNMPLLQCGPSKLIFGHFGMGHMKSINNQCTCTTDRRLQWFSALSLNNLFFHVTAPERAGDITLK